MQVDAEGVVILVFFLRGTLPKAKLAHKGGFRGIVLMQLLGDIQKDIRKLGFGNCLVDVLVIVRLGEIQAFIKLFHLISIVEILHKFLDLYIFINHMAKMIHLCSFVISIFGI